MSYLTRLREYERIKEMTTQMNYNVDRQKQMEKGNSNVLGKEVGKEKDNEKTKLNNTKYDIMNM